MHAPKRFLKGTPIVIVALLAFALGRLSQPPSSGSTADVGGEIGRFDIHNWSSASGEMYGVPPGGPMYQKFLIDYVHYRNGLTVK
jgi:hypothetical protein